MSKSTIALQLTLLFAALASFRGQIQAQTQLPALPANWQQLSPDDFAALVRHVFDQGTFKSLSAVDQKSLAVQGATLFGQIDLATTSLSYNTIEMLEQVGTSKLDQWTFAQAKNAIMARRDDWTGKPYTEIRAKVGLMQGLKVPDTVWVAEARRWVLAGGTQSQVPPNDLVYDLMRQMFTDVKVIDGSFSVDWSGQISAPQSGDYTFLITPIDVNMGFSDAPVKVSTTLFLAGQAIASATPPAPPDPFVATYKPRHKPTSNWVSQSNAVTLTAGKPVNFSFVVSVEAPQVIPPRLIHSTLFWQGPGIAKSLVPASAFSQAKNGNPGLQVTYTWTTNGQQQSLTRIDSMIDSSWTGSPVLLAQDQTVANQSADAMWQAMTSSAFVGSFAGSNPAQLHPFLREPADVSCGLSTARRQAFLDLLLQNPTLLDAMNAQQAVNFFESFRVGTPDKALDVFGAWAGRNADLACEFAFDRFFDADTRLSLARMATLVTQQLPQQVTRLQQQFLQLPDGRCSLPVAYILTYSHLGQGKLADWFATLDAKLADPTITGDLRVNWLLARAQSQEFSRRAPMHYPFGTAYPFSWPIDGRASLFDAFAAAQSPAVKLRVGKEIVARIISSGGYQSATDFLSQVANSMPEPQKSQITNWQQQIAAVVATEPGIIQAQQSEANTAYVRTLQVRRAQAASQGDTTAVNRYDAILNAVSNRH